MSTQKPKLEIIKTSDNVSIQVARFEPEDTPVGIVQVLHGFGEHYGRYQEFAEFFVENKYVCVIHDQRGHGEMPGLSEHERKRNLGILKQYDCFLDDVHAIRSKAGEWYPNLPVVLYGHSMGGNIALNYLLKRSQKEYDKVVLETPWLRLFKPKTHFLLLLSRVLGKASHTIAISDKLNLDDISRDSLKVTEIKNDKYYHNRMSLRIFAQITDAGEYAVENASRLTLPTLLLCAEDDKIICSKAIREFRDKAGKNVDFYEEPKGRHALHTDSEPTKGETLKRILLFCNIQSASLK